MGGKAKPTKHTAKEIKAKAKAAKMNKGGGKSGIKDRKGGKAGHAKLKCPICMQQVKIRNIFFKNLVKIFFKYDIIIIIFIFQYIIIVAEYDLYETTPRIKTFKS